MNEISQKPHLLVIWHSRTGASEKMARAAAGGANVRLMRARDVTPSDLLNAAAYLFVCPENLAAISGEMKEMFDTTYYPVLGRVEGRAFATIISAGSDGENAQRQIDRIAKGWRLKRVAESMIVNFDAQSPCAIMAEKHPDAAILGNCAELGLSMSEGTAMGVF